MARFRYPGPETRRGLLAVLLAGVSVGLPGCDDIPGDAPGPNVSEAGSSAEIDPASGAASDGVLPPPSDPRFGLGRQLLVGGRYAEAEVVLAGLDASGPRHPSVAFLLALAIQKQKRYADALARFDELAALDMSYAERSQLEHFRGWCLFYLGRPAEAADAFAAHLVVHPDEPDSHFGLGVSRLELGEPAMALSCFDRAIEIDLGDPDRRRGLSKAWIRRGDALWELERIEEATASFHKGVIQHPDHYEGWAKLARGHERLGDPSKVEWARREETNARRRVGAPIDGEATEPESRE